MRPIIWILCVLLLPTAVAARTWLVPAEAPTIAAGLDSAASGDTVLVACGSYLETGLVLGSGVTLRGATGIPGCATIDGQGTARILDLASTAAGTRLEGLTFTGGQAPAGATAFDRSGGAIRCDSSVVDVTDCRFVGNAAKFGGGFAGWHSDPVFTRCDFDSNAAADVPWAAGGGLYAFRSAPVFRDCHFTGNTAFADTLPGDGGAVFTDFGEAIADDCTFQLNSSGAGGGAYYSFNFDSSSLNRCTFTDNSSAAGGALYVETSSPVIRDCLFVGNDAANGGAAFVGQFSGPDWFDCQFDSNSAFPNSGGALDIWQSGSEVTRCRFTHNSAGLRGGAVSVNFSSGPNFWDCLFRENSAQDGGAVRLTATALVGVTGCTLVGNSATLNGGGVYAEGSSTIILDRTVVAFSPAGAALTCVGNASRSVVCTNLFGNAGGDWVGCVAGEDTVFGNLSADPLFCDAPGGDVTVREPDSPCLPQNNSCGQLIGSASGGCGCPASATLLVPDDQPTIGAALAVASPGDTVGICDGTYAETVQLVSGVNLLGFRPEVCTVTPGASPLAVLIAHGVTDSTFVQGLTFDGQGAVNQTVAVDSGTTALHLRGNRITGGANYGVRNGADSILRLGGSLEWANDLFANGAPTLHLRNENVAADSIDATLNWWGTTRYDSILTFIEGPVISCPITNEAHADSLCAPLSAVSTLVPAVSPAVLSLSFGPNPLRGSGRVSFELPRPGRARLSVYDVAGRRVGLLHDGVLPAGHHSATWAGPRGRGPAAPGVYFLRLEAAGDSRTRKIVILR